jgi:hypothetical protein
MAEVDYFCDGAFGDQLVEKSDLTANIPDVDDSRYLRQIIHQLRTLIGEVECCHGSVSGKVELSEQPRN